MVTTSTVMIFGLVTLSLTSIAHAAEEGAMRLSIGPRITTHEGQGNVEVFHKNQWGSVCDDEWDEAEGNVVCKALGFQSVDVVTHDGEFGAGRPIFMDNLFCEGNEKKLTECHFDGWQVHDCAPTELAGVRCLKREEETSPLPVVEKNDVIIVDAPPIQRDFFESLRRLHPNDLKIRLRSGRTAMEGRVEVYDDQKNQWGVVCADGFGLLETMTVCRQAGFGYGFQSVRGSAFEQINVTLLPTIIVGLKCTGDETNIADCKYSTQLATCPDDEHAAVICADGKYYICWNRKLPDLVIDKDELERATYLEDRQLSFLTCAKEEHCLSASAYTVHPDDVFTHTRRLLRFTTRVANIGSIPFRPFLPKDEWIWHTCHQHFHSMEVFAHYDVLSSKGIKVAEGHKASFCLEDNFCDETASQVYACANHGDQGISVGCVDTYLHNIDCQWVDVTDVPTGNYTFRVLINPDYKLAESTFDNNGCTCELIYTETYAAVRNCIYERP